MVRNTVPPPRFEEDNYLRSISKTIGIDYDSLDQETLNKLSEFYSGTPKRREAVEATKRKNPDED